MVIFQDISTSLISIPSFEIPMNDIDKTTDGLFKVFVFFNSFKFLTFTYK